MTDSGMGAAPLGKKAFRKAYNREMKRQAEEEVFGPQKVEIIPPPSSRMGKKPPISLTPELKQEIIDRIADGEPLKSILAADNMPTRMTIKREYDRDPEFLANMKMAKEIAADIYVEEMMDIADNASADINPDGSVNYEIVARSKMRIDQRRWYAARLDPARYGDRVQTDITSGGERIEAKDVSPLEAARQVAFALELAKRAAAPKEGQS